MSREVLDKMLSFAQSTYSEAWVRRAVHGDATWVSSAGDGDVSGETCYLKTRQGPSSWAEHSAGASACGMMTALAVLLS